MPELVRGAGRVSVATPSDQWAKGARITIEGSLAWELYSEKLYRRS